MSFFYSKLASHCRNTVTWSSAHNVMKDGTFFLSVVETGKVCLSPGDYTLHLSVCFTINAFHSLFTVTTSCWQRCCAAFKCSPEQINLKIRSQCERAHNVSNVSSLTAWCSFITTDWPVAHSHHDLWGCCFLFAVFTPEALLLLVLVEQY